MTTTEAPILRLASFSAGYDRTPILSDLDLEVNEGDIVGVLGRNGAGKSTLLKSISRLTRVISGSIRFLGEDVTRAKPPEVCSRGIAHVPESRHIFPKLSVEDNLQLGGYASRRRLRSKGEFRTRQADLMDEVYLLFPELLKLRSKLGGTLSGGEQQMVAIGMGLMSDPILLMLDEPSLGLAPIIVERVFDTIRSLRDVNRTVLVVEQRVEQTLATVDRAYVLELGKVVARGSSSDLEANKTWIESAYLG